MIENYFYWISTTLLSLLYLASATMYLVKRDHSPTSATQPISWRFSLQ